MDCCRNVSVSGSLPSEYQPEQVLSPCSKLGSLDDLFSGHSTEGDVNLEWLSVFVEDCLSSTGNCLPPAVLTPNLQNTTKSNSTISKPSKPLQLVRTQKDASFLHKFVIPAKARSKRKRVPIAKAKSSPFTSWSHHLNPKHQTLQMTSSDPPLLQQAYWLADSELILPKKEDCGREIRERDDEQGERKEVLLLEEEEEEEEEENNVNVMMSMGKEDNLGSLEGSIGQQPRRCTHCLSQRTPQWRAGPLGPKTLCNACGVRYKSGRLLPEYRPAKSPTFVSYKHSNSHKKVMEMRMSLLPFNS